MSGRGRRRLCRALASLVGGGLGALFSANRVGVVGGRKEDGAVVAKLAAAASDQLEKEQSAGAIEPGQRLFVGTVNLVVAAVGATFPADLRCTNRGHPWVKPKRNSLRSWFLVGSG